MILNRNFYKKVSFIKSWWAVRKLSKFKNEKVFKSFKLVKYSISSDEREREEILARIPVFIGTQNDIESLQDPELLESICPTNALKVTSDSINIDKKACTACGDCLNVAPKGLLVSKIKIRS